VFDVTWGTITGAKRFGYLVDTPEIRALIDEACGSRGDGPTRSA
jgi:hypothetical protein